MSLCSTTITRTIEPHPDGFLDDETPLTYWRSVAADDFDGELRSAVASSVASIYASSSKAQAAIGGDAEAAIELVERLKAPSKINFQVDLLMTILLNVAFRSDEAADALARALKLMPLDHADRERLSASWSAYHGPEHRLFTGPLP